MSQQVNSNMWKSTDESVHLADVCRDETRYLGPGGKARLLRLTQPVDLPPASGPTMVFIHGLGDAPDSLEYLIREAQVRAMRVQVLAYDTRGRGADAHATALSSELERLAAEGERELTIVAHSLGALICKGALDRLRDTNGHLKGFSRMRFISICTPWAGVDPANLALWLSKQLPDVRSLEWMRDLAPSGPYWHAMSETPLAPEVTLIDVTGSWDLYQLWVFNRSRPIVTPHQSHVWQFGTHTSPLRDTRTAEVIFSDVR